MPLQFDHSLNSSIRRLPTRANGGRTNLELVEEEIECWKHDWSTTAASDDDLIIASLIGKEALEGVSLFDRAQLSTVIQACHESKSMAEAGRRLFAAARQIRTRVNGSYRVRKFLARFELGW